MNEHENTASFSLIISSKNIILPLIPFYQSSFKLPEISNISCISYIRYKEYLVSSQILEVSSRILDIKIISLFKSSPKCIIEHCGWCPKNIFPPHFFQARCEIQVCHRVEKVREHGNIL